MNYFGYLHLPYYKYQTTNESLSRSHHFEQRYKCTKHCQQQSLLSEESTGTHYRHITMQKTQILQHIAYKWKASSVIEGYTNIFKTIQ